MAAVRVAVIMEKGHEHMYCKNMYLKFDVECVAC